MGRIDSTLPTVGKAVSRSDAPTSLADALFTTTQQRVLALLFGQPVRSFYASELIRLTGSGSGAVQRELKRLVSSGLVTVKHIGRQKHFRANPDCPVFDELCAMVRKTVAMVEPIRQALAPLAERIALALIYGSVAKGEDTASSDIDLLVVADELTLEALFEALAPVEANLARKINPTLYTPAEFDRRRAARNPFLTRVVEGEHLVLIGEEDAARRVQQQDINERIVSVPTLTKFKIDASTRLRELTSEDAGALYSLVDSNRGYLRQWLPWVDRQQGPQDSAQFIEDVIKDNQAGVALTLGIEHQGDIAGVIAFHEIDRDNRQTSIGFWISSSHQGKGIVSSSCERLIEYAFTDLGLNRVVMKIAENNIRSRRLAECLGLACEGTCSQSEWLYDHYVNQVIYAITADQWSGDRGRIYRSA